MSHAIVTRAAAVFALAALSAGSAAAQRSDPPATPQQNRSSEFACPMQGYGMHGSMGPGMMYQQGQGGPGGTNWQQMSEQMQAMRQQMQAMREEMMKMRQEMHRQR